jgi:hypothetical protein
MMATATIELIGVLVCVFIALVSLMAAVATLLLIKVLGKWNGYLHLVSSLTVAQGIYDLGFLFIPLYEYIYGRYLYEFCATFGGVSSTIWSNIIMLVTCQIVTTLRSIETEKKVGDFGTHICC